METVTRGGVWWGGNAPNDPGGPHLGFGVSADPAGEGHGHALEHFVVLQLLMEGRRRPPAGGVFVVLHVLVRFFHRGALQAELDLADEPLLEAGHFVLLRDQEGGGVRHRGWRRGRSYPNHVTDDVTGGLNPSH